LARQRNWEWLKDIEAELAFAAIPKPKSHRIVNPDRIVSAGLNLMKEAEAASHLHPKRRASLFRNGLMIALLACIPIRLKNFSALSIGQTIRKIGPHWCVTLPARSTKGKRVDERRVPRTLQSFIERYIGTYRPLLGRSGLELWVGEYGQPLSYSGVEQVLTGTTRKLLGVPICPHLFRTCAASYVALKAGKQPGLASALLQHSDKATTEKYYIVAQMTSVAEQFGQMIEDWR
jgi:integrase